MPNQCSANHSLWPQQARPPRAKQSALATGSFCVGVVASILAYNVLTELAPPAPEATQPSALAHVPVYATPSAPGPIAVEAANSASSSPVAAKLPSMRAAPAVVGLETDGRGGEARGSGAPAVASTTPSTPPIKAAEFAKPAAEPPAQTAEVLKPADESPAVTAEPAAKPAVPERPRVVQKKRAQPNAYARNRNAPVFPFFGALFGQRG
jgi:hypothetical protein